MTSFFSRRGPPAKYGGGQGRPFHLYSSHHSHTRQTDHRRGRQAFRLQRQAQRHPFHEPNLSSEQKKTNRKILDILATLPRSSLGEIGINMDTSIARQEAHRPVGGRLAYFLPNWKKISSDKWVQDTVTGYKLDLLSIPHQQHKPATILDSGKRLVMAEQVDALHNKEAITRVPNPEEGFVKKPSPESQIQKKGLSVLCFWSQSQTALGDFHLNWRNF